MIDDVIYTMLIVVALILNINLIYHFIRSVIKKYERSWVTHIKMEFETTIWVLFIVMTIGILDIYHEWLDDQKINSQLESMDILWILFIKVPLIVLCTHMSARWMRVLIFYIVQRKDTPYNRLLKSQRHIDFMNGADFFIKTLNEMHVSDVAQLKNLDCITETNIMKAILYGDIKNKEVKEALKLKILNDTSNKKVQNKKMKKI